MRRIPICNSICTYADKYTRTYIYIHTYIYIYIYIVTHIPIHRTGTIFGDHEGRRARNLEAQPEMIAAVSAC